MPGTHWAAGSQGSLAWLSTQGSAPQTPNAGSRARDRSGSPKAATIDQALLSLDSALCTILTLTANSLTSPYTIPYAAGDEPAVTKTALRFFKANVTGAIAADWTAYMPTGKQKFFAMANQTTGSKNVIVKVSGQTGAPQPARIPGESTLS